MTASMAALRALLAGLAAAGPVTAAAAEMPPCAPRAELLAALADRYGERPLAAGPTNGGALLELLARPDGTSWSLIIDMPGGRACLLAAGTDWAPAPPPGEDL